MQIAKKDINSVIKIIIALITAFFIFLFSLSVVGTVLTSKQYILYCVSSSDYLKNSLPILKEELSALTIPSGLSENFFDDKIDSEALYNINCEYINSCYDKGVWDITPSGLKQALKQDLVDSFKEYANSGALASSVNVNDTSLGYLADKCVALYARISTHGIFRHVSLFASKVHKYLPFAIIFTFALSILGIIFLVILSKGTKKDHLYFALCGAGCMSSILPIILLITGYFGNLAISSRAMRILIATYFNNALIALTVFGLILIAVAIIILLKAKNKQINFSEN